MIAIQQIKYPKSTGHRTFDLAIIGHCSNNPEVINKQRILDSAYTRLFLISASDQFSMHLEKKNFFPIPPDPILFLKLSGVKPPVFYLRSPFPTLQPNYA